MLFLPQKKSKKSEMRLDLLTELVELYGCFVKEIA